MGHQSFVVRLPERLSRQMRAFVDSAGSGYQSADEFVEVAIRNQLALDQSPSGVEVAAVNTDDSAKVWSLLSPLSGAPVPTLVPSVGVPGTLSVMTNRLSPLKIAVRVLCNLARTGEWPEVKQFQEHAAQCARAVGLRLRESENQRLAKGAERRSTAFPVSADRGKALDRFVAHFTTAKRIGVAPGPLELLGLARIQNGAAEATAAGWDLAAAPNPLLEECEGWTLGSEEKQVFLGRLKASADEGRASTRFLRLVRRSAGNQSRLDELHLLEHAGWTASVAVANRAAMTGRLRELGLLDVDGRGPDARVRLTAEGNQWIDEHAREER